MTPRELANLCCRLLAVYVLIIGVSAVPSVLTAVGMYTSAGMPGSMWIWYILMVTLYPAMQIGLGLWLWRKSNIVSAWMIGHDLQDAPDEPDVEHRRPNAREMHAIAFSTMGLWLLVTSVPTLISGGVAMAVYGQQSDALPENYANAWGIHSLGDVAKTLIGAYLLFGASGLVGLLRGAKNFGLDETEQPGYAKRDQTPPQDG